MCVPSGPSGPPFLWPGDPSGSAHSTRELQVLCAIRTAGRVCLQELSPTPDF